jgi:hypothetical protein
VNNTETKILARIGERRGLYTVLVGKPEGEKDHWGDPEVDGRIILTV